MSEAFIETIEACQGHFANCITLNPISYIRDEVDRFGTTTAVKILFLCVFITSSLTLVSESVACFIPTHLYSSNVLGFINGHCLTDNMYNPPLDRVTLPQRKTEWDVYEQYNMRYYKYIQVLLGIMAIFYTLPKLFGKLLLSNCSKISVGRLIELSTAGTEYVDFMVGIMDDVFKLNILKRPQTNFDKFSMTINKSLLFLKFLVVKMIYLLNYFLQLLLISITFGSTFDFIKFGFRLFNEAFGDRTLIKTEVIFPTETVCFNGDIRVLGDNTHATFAQCTMPMNAVNEKIFLFLWCYAWAMVLMTVMSVLSWFWTMNRNIEFVKRLLVQEKAEVDDEMIKSFVKNYLGVNGCFLLQFVHLKANRFIAGLLARGLLERFLKRIY